jgi:hypothetical protein
MIHKIVFLFFFVWAVLRLVQAGRLGLDLASFTLGLIAIVMGISFSQALVEGIAEILGFSTPSLSVVALILAGVLLLSVSFAVSISDLQRRNAKLIRRLAAIELKDR